MKTKLVLSSKVLNTLCIWNAMHTIARLTLKCNHIRKMRRKRKKKPWRDRKILDCMIYLKKWKSMTLSSVYPNCYKLFYHLLLFPLSTVCRERLFSKMKLIKTGLWNNLSQSTLENLLFIVMEAWKDFHNYHYKHFNELKRLIQI